MSRALFIGDSHTCGYWSHPTNQGPGSYSFWNDNNYAEVYGEYNQKPVAIYAMAGVNNRVYTDWMKSMFDIYDDIDEVFLCMAPFNRFTIAFDGKLDDTVIPVNHFITKMDSSNGNIDRYCDLTLKDEYLQFFNKFHSGDYEAFPGIELDPQVGLKNPDIRKNTFAEIKLFFEMNTFIEKRDFLLNVFAWDRICWENKAKLYLFNVTDRLRYPQTFQYYGELLSTKFTRKSVETFMRERHIDHTKYLIEDKEHYNREYHELIATKYLPWLKTL